MKAVIIEDEVVAIQNLQRLINQLDNNIEIIAILKSVEESIEWLSLNTAPDLIFMDIHLSDGSAFSIFNKVTISSPIIFTTAYDEYALKAFEVNSIDYLLKPISKSDLERAIGKYKGMNLKRDYDEEVMTNIFSMLKDIKSPYKSKLLIPHKDKFIPLDVEDIAYIYSENKMAKIVSLYDHSFIINNSLEEVSKQLSPSLFFRANRQFILSRKSIKEIVTWFDSKLAINLCVSTPEKIIISRAKVQDFKSWYTD